MRFTWLLAALLVAATPAHADPASLSVAFLGAKAATSAIAIQAAFLKIGAGLALSALSRAVFKPEAPKQKAPGLFSEYSVGEGVPLTVAWGRSAVRGHKLGPSYSEGSGPTPNKRLYRPTIISDMPVTSLQSVIIEGEEHSVSGTSVSGKFGAWFRFTGLHLGPNASTDAEMLTDFGGHGERPWQSDMIGRDIAWLVPVMETDVDGDKFTSEPFPLYEVQGAPLYDPRTGATAYTENPVVMIWNILRGIEIPGVGTWGLNVDEDDLPAAIWEAAMDVCDEVTGGEARYRAGLEFGLNNEPLEIIGELLKACGGDIADCGGSWRITVGPPETPVWSFDDGDVVITEGRDFQPFKGLAETYNGVSATYRDPRNAWEETQAEPYYNAEWEAEDGRKSIAELILPTVPYPKQVRRLMREMGDDNRRMRVHSFTQPKSALHVMPLNNEAWTSEENGYDAKSFEVVSKSFDPVSLVSRVAVRERDPEDYDFDEDFDAVLPDPPSRVRDDFTIYGVNGFDCVGSAVVDDDGTDRRLAALASWQVEDVDGLEISIFHNNSNQHVVTKQIGPGAVNRREPGEDFGKTYITADGFLPSAQYRARAKVVAAGRPSTWSADVLFTMPGVRLGYSDFDAQIQADIDHAQAQAESAAEDVNDALARITGIEGETFVTTTQDSNGRTGLAIVRGDGTLLGAIQLNSPFVIAPGTLGASRLVVSDFSGNNIPDAAMADPDAWTLHGPSTDQWVHDVGQTDSQSLGRWSYDGPLDVGGPSIRSSEFSVFPGETLTGSASIKRGYNAGASAVVLVQIVFLDANGAEMSPATTSSWTTVGIAYTKVETVSAAVPTDARTAKLRVVIDTDHVDTTAGMIVSAPEVVKKKSGSTLILPDSIYSEHMRANSITAANGAIANLTVGTLKVIDNAITESASASWGGPSYRDAGDGELTLISLSIDGADAKTVVMARVAAASGEFDGVSSWYATSGVARIYRDGVLLDSVGASLPEGSTRQRDTLIAMTVDPDSGSGSVNYQLRVEGTTVGEDIEFSVARMIVLHTKK